LRIDICPSIQPHHIVKGVSVVNTADLKACGVGHGAGFLFVGDLTNKATGAVLVVLIVLYIGTQLASSLMMSSATMDKNQRRLMLAMPLLFVLFVINFPAGVIVYWITTNTWTMAQQYVVKRRIGPIRPAVAGAGAAGGATSVVPTSKSPPKRGDADGAGGENGSSSGGGGIGALIRGRSKEKEAAAVVTRSGPPPRPPRKKKKRSGRRR
jgi:YidC/Oxa1 family membrane protein insertase